jgi:T5SS/PEP-CTERM-associated repeat protein
VWYMKCFNLIGRQYLLVAMAVTGLLASARLQAANDVWKTAVSGTWSAGLNWVDGSSPSSIFDSATFNLPGAYTVSYSADPDPIGALTLASGANVTFASAVGRDGITVVSRSLRLVDTGAHPGKLAVAGGSTLTLGRVTGGFPSTSQPFHLTVDKTISLSDGGTLNARFGSQVDAQLISVGVPSQEGQGRLSVSSGAAVTSHFGLIGSSGSSGDVTVSGVGSRWDLTSLNLCISDGQTGSIGMLSITGGGVVTNINSGLGGTGTIAATVTVSGDGSLWKMNGLLGIDQSGTVQIQPGGTVIVDQDTVVFSAGRVRLQGGTFDTEGFRFSGDGQFEWTSGTLHVGTYHGDLIQPTGILAPGHSAGSTTVLGNYTQEAPGVLEIEIGGAAQGTQYDVVNVSGDAMLGGQLDLELINGFVPTPSQSFIIMSADAVAGAFNNVPNGQRLSAAGGGSFRVNYGPGSAFDPTLIVLSAFQAADLSGDYNGDGMVNLADYTVWRDSLGAPAGTLPNDVDGGVIDLDQYNTWRTNFGQTLETLASATERQIPEPASLSVLLFGAAACGSRWRRVR